LRRTSAHPPSLDARSGTVTVAVMTEAGAEQGRETAPGEHERRSRSRRALPWLSSQPAPPSRAANLWASSGGVVGTEQLKATRSQAPLDDAKRVHGGAALGRGAGNRPAGRHLARSASTVGFGAHPVRQSAGMAKRARKRTWARLAISPTSLATASTPNRASRAAVALS